MNDKTSGCLSCGYGVTCYYLRLLLIKLSDKVSLEAKKSALQILGKDCKFWKDTK